MYVYSYKTTCIYVEVGIKSGEQVTHVYIMLVQNVIKMYHRVDCKSFFAVFVISFSDFRIQSEILSFTMFDEFICYFITF